MTHRIQLHTLRFYPISNDYFRLIRIVHEIPSNSYRRYTIPHRNNTSLRITHAESRLDRLVQSYSQCPDLADMHCKSSNVRISGMLWSIHKPTGNGLRFNPR